MPSAPPPLSRSAFNEIVDVVRTALVETDAIVLGRQHRVAIQRKLDGSEVTAADRGAERSLRRHLRRAWPTDALLGEEYGGSIAPRGRTWLIDPIDGTSSYVLGLGTFGTLISLLIDGAPVFGCIHLPAMQETTYAATGHGCWLRRGAQRPRRVRVGVSPPVSRAQVGLTSFKRSDLTGAGGPWRLSTLARTVGRVRLVGDCVQYALLCRGELDAAVDPAMHAWDIAPLMVCVREAGGTVGDLAGSTGDLLQADSFMAASSDRLLRAIRKSVSGA
jgi:histidinol-phosphatase